MSPSETATQVCIGLNNWRGEDTTRSELKEAIKSRYQRTWPNKNWGIKIGITTIEAQGAVVHHRGPLEGRRYR